MKASEDKAAKPRGMRGLGRVYGRQHGPAPRSGEPDKRPTIWWIEFWHDGVQHRESSRSEKHTDAVRLLRRRHAQVAQGHLMVTADKVTFEDLAAMVTADYTVNGRDLRRAKLALAHLRETFGHTRAVNIAGQLDAWVATRRETKDAAASIKRDLSVLGRAFSLAVRSGRLPFRPRLPDLAVENTRTDSFTRAELDAVLRVLMHGAPATAKDPALRAQPDLVPPIVFAAASGWRLTSDVFTIKWSQVDFAAGTVTRWSRGTSKASRHVVFPFGVMPEVAALLQRQREVTSALERQTGSIVPWLFHRRGRAIKDLYSAWRGACRRAGVPGRVPHDLRRAAARTLRTLGMDDRDIAEIVGWDTQVMVSRYLGRDPAGVAGRLRLKVAESESRTRTFPARSQDVASGGDEG